MHSGEVLSDDALRIRGAKVVYVNVDGHGRFLRGLMSELGERFSASRLNDGLGSIAILREILITQFQKFIKVNF